MTYAEYVRPVELLDDTAEQAPKMETCFAAYNTATIRDARQLTAREYLRRNFIAPSDIGEDDVMTAEADPHHAHSKYYVTTTDDGEQVSGTIRSITYNKEIGVDSFPVLHHMQDFYPEAIERIEQVGYSELIELSALVRDKNLDKDGMAALRLYRELFRDMWANDKTGNATLIMACNPMLFENFKLLFDGSMERIGPDLPYPGQEAIPAMFTVRPGTINVIEKARDKSNPYRNVQECVVGYFLAGSSVDKIHPDIIEALEANGFDSLVEKMRNGDWGDLDKLDKQIGNRLKRAVILGKIREKTNRYRPEMLASAGLIGYTLVRTGAVAGGISPVSDASWEAFLAIELATTPQYVWGVGDLIRGADKDREDYPLKRKIGAAAAAASGFVAPYAYLASEGALNSEQGAMVAGGMVAIAGVTPIAKAVKKRFRRNHTKQAKETSESE